MRLTERSLIPQFGSEESVVDHCIKCAIGIEAAPRLAILHLICFY